MHRSGAHEYSCGSIRNEYAGFSFQEPYNMLGKDCLSSSSSKKLEDVEPTILPKDFFERFVRLRKPCILRGFTAIRISEDDLKAVAGDEVSGDFMDRDCGLFLFHWLECTAAIESDGYYATDCTDLYSPFLFYF
jgi:hypothetical protein